MNNWREIEGPSIGVSELAQALREQDLAVRVKKRREHRDAIYGHKTIKRDVFVESEFERQKKTHRPRTVLQGREYVGEIGEDEYVVVDVFSDKKGDPRMYAFPDFPLWCKVDQPKLGAGEHVLFAQYSFGHGVRKGDRMSKLKQRELGIRKEEIDFGNNH